MTGAVDGKSGTISVWFRFDAEAGENWIFAWGRGKLLRTTTNTNLMEMWGNTTGNSNILKLTSITDFPAAGDGGDWHHLLASWDLAAGAGSGRLYIDDVDDKVETTYTDDTIDYTGGGGSLMANGAGSKSCQGVISEMWFEDNVYIDFDVEANRRKFITSAGLPANLGDDGSLPTGTAPLVYLNDPVATFTTNKGTGGDYVVQGAPTAYTPSPSVSL